jgi:hypothetical protein
MVVPTTLAVRTRAGEFVFTSFGLSVGGDMGDIASVMVFIPLLSITYHSDEGLRCVNAIFSLLERQIRNIS